MKNWKISRIQIQGFKAFSFSDLDFEANSLITLEGPNGYGKTSVFDAIELLLTGRIERLSRLFSTVMLKKQVKYDDNLYWNTKKGKETLFIKVEFVDLDTGFRPVFARFALPEKLSLPSNNRADKFDIFKLCSLETFDSIDFSTELPGNYFDEIFGENFSKNYSMLNYLHQGENQFIFGSSTVDRKGVLESLIDCGDINDRIEYCNRIERKLSTLINSPTEEAEVERLKKTVNEFEALPEGMETIEHASLASRSPPPDWDSKTPFPAVDKQRFLDLTEKVNILLACSEPQAREEIRKRVKNRKIEQYIEREGGLFSLAVSIGKHIDQYDALKEKSGRIASLGLILARLRKEAKSFSAEDVAFVTSKGVTLDAAVGVTIATRDAVTSRAKELNTALAALVTARQSLADAHAKVTDEHSATCPMCGHDWETAEQLRNAFEVAGSAFGKELEVLAKQLAEAIATLEEHVIPIRNRLTEEQQGLEKGFDKRLLEELEASKESFDNVRRLNGRLEELNVSYEADFVTDEDVLSARKASLIQQVRAQKAIEGDNPPLNWEATISEAFAPFDGFYAIETQRLVSKLEFLAYAYRVSQNAALQVAKRQLSEKGALKEARTAARTRIRTLKSVLSETERRYSGKTIADIELTFHIYSGRLIQNYQRGLGLFIERGEGTKLQFSTADRSEHDATLSMSSGQISALSLAFFLALNRVYSKTPFVLIDDPAQSLDDINVASLTDLLRCELRDRQLLLSSHEDDIAAYMRYRFSRANLSQKAFHMQTHLNG
ncbi:AAA family ATPase [Burkholderia sp. Ax-1719]|uniref:AAA family ATPase n=1 Tax=Burkholderia sp. Ax-1719 TaxID=2608334 RepID=UPI00142428FC|nr:AAA family ATPase [Burkholderia sp. Ax-1719]NIE63136.1 AAA family ATPase [Burkholderia sp. Ax-1719]